jgi:hypothetical protein
MSAPSRTSTSHSVLWDADQPTFTCDGDTNAWCHLFPDCDCEEWSDEHGQEMPGHEMVAHETECWVLSWLNNVDVGNTYGDGDQLDISVPRHNALIDWEWQGDGILLWTYEDDDLNGLRDVEDEE